ncbi:MAG: ferritin-like domain-containing protein [Gemmatimonadota bacterium]
MNLDSMEKLFIHHLKDLYSAEKQLTHALPKMAEGSTSPKLRKGFEDHLVETEKQIERIEQIFETLEGSPAGVKCMGMEGLIEEGKEMLEAEADPVVRDAGLIAGAQRVEHYEISSYGTAVAWAELLGYSDAATLLRESLDEESATNEKLNALAESEINVSAPAES